MKAFNEYQMAAKKTYAEGEFSDVRTLAGTKKVGDPLFAFVMAELDDVEDCEDAVRRMERAKEDLDAVILALQEG